MIRARKYSYPEKPSGSPSRAYLAAWVAAAVLAAWLLIDQGLAPKYDDAKPAPALPNPEDPDTPSIPDHAGPVTSGRRPASEEISSTPISHIEGRIVDANITPIANCTISVQVQGHARARSAQTTADGKFHLTAPANLPLTIELAHPDWPPTVAVFGLHLDPNDRRNLGDLILRRGPKLLVKIKFGGLPLAGARCELDLIGRETSMPGVSSSTSSWRARTEANGTATFHGIPDGAMSLRVEATGVITSEREILCRPSSVRTQEIRVQMFPGHSLHGRIIDGEGRPIGRARLRTTTLASGIVTVGQTAKDGTFELSGLPRGGHHLLVESHSHGIMEFDAIPVLPESEPRIIRILPRTGPCGFVTCKGRPLAGARVRALSRQGLPVILSDGSRLAGTRTDERGYFALHGLSEGLYRVEVVSDLGNASSPPVPRDSPPLMIEVGGKAGSAVRKRE